MELPEIQQYYKIGHVIMTRSDTVVGDPDSDKSDDKFIVVGFPKCEQKHKNCPKDCSHCLGLKSIEHDFLIKSCGFIIVNTGYCYSKFRILRNDSEKLEQALGQGCNVI